MIEPEPLAPRAEEPGDVTMRARKRAFEVKLEPHQKETMKAHSEAHLADGAKRAAIGQRHDTPSSAPVSMPASREWVAARTGTVSEGQLRRMIVEMTSLNKQHWSRATLADATNGPHGTAQHVMASLAAGPLALGEQDPFPILDFGDTDDPVVPDWQNLESAGILPHLREAKSRIYAEGSQPKIRTALNHWLRYTATKAHVSFLRPRVGDDPDAFLTESLLRQGFIVDLVAGGCNVDTAEGYASLFNGWHIDTMGYGLVSSNTFDDEQYKRTKQGLRRMHPATKIERAGHQTNLNEAVLRKELAGVFSIYDEPGTMTREKWGRIERELKNGSVTGFDSGRMTDLVYCALTELMTDGLLRPGEGVPRRGFISQSDVSFDRDASGKLLSCTVMIMPIKQRGKDVANVSKRPIVIKANRGGSLRTAELLDILSTVVPCRVGEESSTPAIRFPVERMEGLNRRQKESLANPTLRKVMSWYHAKCKSARGPDHDLVKPHSFRIAGATLLFAMGVTAEEIKQMGRWSSDCYRLYTRLTKERLLELSSKMGDARTTQFVNGLRGWFDTTLEVEPVETGTEASGDGAEEAATAANTGYEEESVSEDGYGSDSMSDEEFERRCGTAQLEAAEATVPIESLFEDDDSDDEAFGGTGR